MAPPIPGPTEADIASRFYNHYLPEIPLKYAIAFLDFLATRTRKGFEAPIAQAIMKYFPVDQFGGEAPEKIIRFERLRPLNGYLVFRAYISPALPGIPQKAKSTFIGSLWHHDLHQAQWIIMAHAYTILRDNFELDERSVPRFVQIVAIQLFGFPAPARYMRMCGWVVDIAHLGLSYRAWPPDFRGMTLRRTTTVDDIVKHCLDEGLALCKKFNSTWVPENQCSALALAQGPTDERPIPPALRLVLDQNDIINLDFSEFSLLEVFGNDFTSALPAQVQGPNPVNASIPAQGLPQAQAQVQAQPQALQQPSGSLTNNP